MNEKNAKMSMQKIMELGHKVIYEVTQASN